MLGLVDPQNKLVVGDSIVETMNEQAGTAVPVMGVRIDIGLVNQ